MLMYNIKSEGDLDHPNTQFALGCLAMHIQDFQSAYLHFNKAKEVDSSMLNETARNNIDMNITYVTNPTLFYKKPLNLMNSTFAYILIKSIGKRRMYGYEGIQDDAKFARKYLPFRFGEYSKELKRYNKMRQLNM